MLEEKTLKIMKKTSEVITKLVEAALRKLENAKNAAQGDNSKDLQTQP